MCDLPGQFGIGPRHCTSHSAERALGQTERENIGLFECQRAHKPDSFPRAFGIAAGALLVVPRERHAPGPGDAFGHKSGIEARLIRTQVFQECSILFQLARCDPIGGVERNCGVLRISRKVMHRRPALRQPRASPSWVLAQPIAVEPSRGVQTVRQARSSRPAIRRQRPCGGARQEFLVLRIV